jgi:ribokinase
MTRKIVVIGSSNADFIMKMDRLPRLGETVTDALFMQTFGGKGANQAVGAARSGGEVSFVNCVGDDVYGKLIKENLRAAGVQVDHVFEEQGVASGAALVMVGSEGQNLLSVAPGANYRLTPAYIDRVRPVIESAAMVVMQYEILPETLRYAVQTAAGLGKPVILNLAPARPLEDETLAGLFALVVNENEAEFLVGYPVDTAGQVQRAAQDLLKKGPKWAIVTLGSHGLHAAGPGQAFDIPAFAVKAVDTTAAGDIFCGSLATALVEGQEMALALRFASAAAAISVTRLGAQPSAPGREEIERLLAGEVV